MLQLIILLIIVQNKKETLYIFRRIEDLMVYDKLFSTFNAFFS